MRYLAFQSADGPQIGRVTGDQVETLCDLETFYDDPSARMNAPAVPGSAQLVADVVQVPPVPQTAQILCVGLNYVAHIEETKSKRPEAPNLFARWYRTLLCQDGELPVPSGEVGLDWEGELAVIIGKEMVDVSEEEAMEGVLGYTCFNDISARIHQRRTPQWALGKNPKGSGPIGPVVVTADEFGDPHQKHLETRYNGDVVQSSTTDLMIFKIAETISYASKCITLYPGDVFATGTPSGVGSRMDPPVLMTAGDRIEVEIEDIGVLRSRIV